MAAEAEARNKKRKAEGKPPLEEDVRRAAAIEAPKEGTSAAEEDEANKRRKLLQEALEMDKDDDDDEEEQKNAEEDEDERYAPQAVCQVPYHRAREFVATRNPRRRTILPSSSVSSRRSNAKEQRKRRGRTPRRTLNSLQIERRKLRPGTLC